VVESDVAKLTQTDTQKIVDECYYCKLCYNHCPYTPPHHFDLDFPRLMLAWKRVYAQEGRPSLRDRLLVNTDLLGTVGSRLAAMANWVVRTPFLRALMHRVVGIHRERQVLPFQRETFPCWWDRTQGERESARRAAGGEPIAKVALFSGCTVDYHKPEIGQAAVQVLEKNHVEVVRPDQRCCGMPYFDVGDVATIRKKASANLAAFLPWVRKGYDIIIPTPSCSLMFKREYPELLTDHPDQEAAQLVAQRTFDVCEYLMRLKQQGKLNMNFHRLSKRIAYQAPCHLRDQNIGFKSKELMELTGATVEVIERCTGHDGTWAVKREFFDLSMKIAGKVVTQVKQASPDIVASDCPLAALQIDQAAQASAPTLHPIQIVKQAYGL
jgi:Fe-S oxidoreductase